MILCPVLPTYISTLRSYTLAPVFLLYTYTTRDEGEGDLSPNDV